MSGMVETLSAAPVNGDRSRGSALPHLPLLGPISASPRSVEHLLDAMSESSRVMSHVTVTVTSVMCCLSVAESGADEAHGLRVHNGK